MDAGVFCIPVKEKKKNKWKINEEFALGAGQYGTVFAACKHAVCKYVMKVIPFTSKYSFKDFNKEVEMQKEIASIGLTIPVEDSWKCPKKLGVIVMKSLDMTVRSFFLEAPEEDIDEVFKGIETLIDKLHTLGYYHGDNHFGNIMMKSVENAGENTVVTSLGTYKLYLIDMGKAGKLDDPGFAAYGKTTREKRIRDDHVITKGEMRNVLARLRPDDPESIFI